LAADGKGSLRQKHREREKPVFLRRSPFLISYWQDGQLLFENYLTRKKTAASAETAAVLDFFSDWKRIEEMFRRWPGYTKESLLAAASRLLHETLLEGSHRTNPPEESRQKLLRQWKAWIPAASYFHLSTKDIYAKEVTMAEIRYVEALAKVHPVQQPLKNYPGAPVIKLRRGAVSGEFPGVLKERRTWREFSRRPVENQAFADLLYLAFGVQAWEQIPQIGRLAQKTSPSGGALHPIEAYVLARRIRGIGPGVYHYDAGGHRLQELRRGMSGAEIQRYLAGQWWFRDAAFVVFLTAVFGRTQWKYDYARAYRAILIEAGHLCQTFCLTATWLGLAPFCTIALADTKIEKTLGLDGISESVIYALGAGEKPDKK
jgi:SagB-type dehydrogenase family enzyme